MSIQINLTKSESEVAYMAITLLQSIIKTNKLGLPIDNDDEDARLWKSELEMVRFKIFQSKDK